MIGRPHTDIAQSEDFIRDCIEAWHGGDRLPYILVHPERDLPIGMLDARFHGHMVGRVG